VESLELSDAGTQVGLRAEREDCEGRLRPEHREHLLVLLGERVLAFRLDVDDAGHLAPDDQGYRHVRTGLGQPGSIARIDADVSDPYRAPVLHGPAAQALTARQDGSHQIVAPVAVAAQASHAEGFGRLVEQHEGGVLEPDEPLGLVQNLLEQVVEARSDADRPRTLVEGGQRDDLATGNAGESATRPRAVIVGHRMSPRIP
jgi:hypothetical protein